MPGSPWCFLEFRKFPRLSLTYVWGGVFIFGMISIFLRTVDIVASPFVGCILLPYRVWSSDLTWPQEPRMSMSGPSKHRRSGRDAKFNTFRPARLFSRFSNGGERARDSALPGIAQVRLDFRTANVNERTVEASTLRSRRQVQHFSARSIILAVLQRGRARAGFRPVLHCPVRLDFRTANVNERAVEASTLSATPRFNTFGPLDYSRGSPTGEIGRGFPTCATRLFRTPTALRRRRCVRA